jgi:anaerobic magnesium-protoporphyrin IX monomethyl ester cyclase
MKILLVYSVPPARCWPQGLFRSRWVPSGIAYVGRALIRAGHEVRAYMSEEQLMRLGLDRRAAERRFRELLAEFRPEVIGFSATTASVTESARMAGVAKEVVGSQALTVIGGPHCSALPERTLAESPAVDVVVVGEGEATLVELLERGPRGDVAGIGYREDGSVTVTAPRPMHEDLDGLGSPAYELFDMAHYTAADRWMIRWLKLRATNVRTSRGCPNRCRFCAGHVTSGVGVRCRSIAFVVDEVTRVVRRYGVEAIRFEDDTLGADRARLLELCEAMRRRDLHRCLVWECCLRVDQPDAELLASMKSAGCIQVEYGFESGSDACLVRLGKNTTGDLNRRAVRLTREAGLRIFADIMVGLPGETAADFDATVRFLRWARPEVISAARLAPLPGTPIYDGLPEDVKRSLDWAGYSYLDYPGFDVNLTAMSDDEFRRRYHDFLKYFVRPALVRELLRDTPVEDRGVRRQLRAKARAFALKHPVRACRLPV